MFLNAIEASEGFILNKWFQAVRFIINKNLNVSDSELDGIIHLFTFFYNLASVFTAFYCLLTSW